MNWDGIMNRKIKFRGKEKQELVLSGQTVIEEKTETIKNLKVEIERLETKLKEKEAEKKANEMKQQTLTDNIIKEKFIEKWNGELPKVSNGNSLFNIDSLLK